ncbi:hypothetical protein [Paraburkholderia sediminicola]|uniref:hypothetical protein n=1 Tax=Paraburkholderia sediminicola TaxID=458836 RepID=UPI0038B90CC7
MSNRNQGDLQQSRGPIHAGLSMNWQEATMKTRVFTYVKCPCGHRGALIETIDADVFTNGWHKVWLRKLNHAGTYQGGDGLFAKLKPGCPACGRSLGPDDVVGRNELQGTGEVLRLKNASESSEATLSVGC